MDFVSTIAPRITQALDINFEGMVSFFMKELNQEVNNLMLQQNSFNFIEINSLSGGRG